MTAWLLILVLSEAPCPPARTVRVNLPQWTQALKRTSPAAAAPLLTTLQLPALPAGEHEWVSVTLLSSAGLAADQLVVAEFRMKDDLRTYRVQWLRPLRPGVFCALGADLSQEFWASRRSACPAGEDEPDTFTELSFAFTPLLSQARPSVETVLTVSQNSCRGIRGTMSTHSFWEATWQIPTLALKLSQSDYRSAGTDTSTREWFTLSSPAPRVAECC